MSFWRGNTKDVDENGTYTLLPEGEYTFEIFDIEKKTTKAGDPMAAITLKVKTGEFANSQVWDNLVFPLPNSSAIKILGRSKHFLHCIGEPYDEDDLQVNPDNWNLKSVRAKIKHEIYEDKNGNPKTKAAISEYLLSEEAAWDASEDSPDL